MDAALKRPCEFQCQNGGGDKDMILHRVDRLSGNPDDLRQLRLGEPRSLAAFSQVRYEFQTILAVR